MSHLHLPSSDHTLTRIELLNARGLVLTDRVRRAGGKGWNRGGTAWNSGRRANPHAARYAARHTSNPDAPYHWLVLAIDEALHDRSTP